MNFSLVRPCALMAVAGLAAGLAGSGTASATDVPAYIGQHHATPADRVAIEQLLATYTRSVTNRDEAAFESLLLDKNIPFASTGIVGTNGDAAAIDTRRYAGFNAAVFHSDARRKQTFHNIRIEQDNDLAQVSLDFMNVSTDDGSVSYGWKLLQLLKVRGQWKIASELYTVYAAP